MQPQLTDNSFEVILGNANKRFSGVTSTMLQNYEHQRTMLPVTILGKHHLPRDAHHIHFLKLAFSAQALLEGERYRVFHARRNIEMLQALILKHIFRAKIRILFTSTAQRYHSGFTRFLMNRMDMVISTCKAAAAYLQKRPSYVVPHGIQLDTYQAKAQKFEEDELIVSIFGRVREQKGSHLFVRACIECFKSTPKVKARIVGSITPENKALVNSLKKEIQAAGLGDRIEFMGEQTFSAIPKLFQDSAIVAALSSNEGYGLTVIEAMASGAAVLATKAGAWPEIVRHGIDGYVVDTKDQASITEHLGKLLSDRTRLSQMAHSGWVRANEHYDIRVEAAKLVDIYRELQAPDFKRR